MNYSEMALELHRKCKGKIEIQSKCEIRDAQDLSTVYTPGVAAPCLAIRDNEDDVYAYTSKGNMVAVVSDGSAVLGLGNIGPKAAIPVMEGKAALFKRFGGVDAIPVCLDTQDAEEIVRTVQLIAPCSGGINLEDISSPRCFEIEERLKQTLDIPVLHDDQHGTAIVVAAALTNALRVVKKELKDCRVVLCGFGAAGTAITKLLLEMGAKDFIAVDRDGILAPDAPLDQTRLSVVKRLNPRGITGSLLDALQGADVFIGVSAPGVVTGEMVRAMNRDAVLFAMANPTPEIMPDLALRAGAKIVGTGRSDFPNQVNNSLAFPGLFKGALDARAKQITEKMKIAAVYAIAGIIPQEELSETNIIPTMFDERVAPAVAKAVREAWEA